MEDIVLGSYHRADGGESGEACQKAYHDEERTDDLYYDHGDESRFW